MNYIKTCDLSSETWDRLKDAIQVILSGTCKRVDVDKTVKVYECKDVIRIDLKIVYRGE